MAALLDLSRRIQYASFSEYRSASEELYPDTDNAGIESAVLAPEEIRQQAINARYDRAVEEYFRIFPGDLLRGRHIVRTKKGEEYTVTLYDPETLHGHCTCPDFTSNHLDLCKHLIFAHSELQNRKKYAFAEGDAPFPFVHISWSSRMQKPVCYYDQIEDDVTRKKIEELFTPLICIGKVYEPEKKTRKRKKQQSSGIREVEAPDRFPAIYTQTDILPLYRLYAESDSGEGSILSFGGKLLEMMGMIFRGEELQRSAAERKRDYSFLKTALYPYQEEGVEFSAFREAAVIADEMGLGKTLQAIATAIIKKEVFGFTKTLIVCPASLKSQWEQEIAKFSDESVFVLSGTREQRIKAYLEDDSFFKITNYEALRNDINTVEQWTLSFSMRRSGSRISRRRPIRR